MRNALWRMHAPRPSRHPGPARGPCPARRDHPHRPGHAHCLTYLLVTATLLSNVALRALQLENLGTLGHVASGGIGKGRHCSLKVDGERRWMDGCNVCKAGLLRVAPGFSISRGHATRVSHATLSHGAPSRHPRCLVTGGAGHAHTTARRLVQGVFSFDLTEKFLIIAIVCSRVIVWNCVWDKNIVNGRL